jgi:outer membrane beta-barrel protein
MKSAELSNTLPRKWGVRLILLIGAGLWLSLIAMSWAEASPINEGIGESGRAPSSESESVPVPEAAPASTDEYNFSWLDPEKKIYVLQNRRYLKTGHFMGSLMAGPGISNAYRNTIGYGLRGAYYFNEAFGLEAFHTVLTNTENNTFAQLRFHTSNVVPVVREIQSQSGLLLNYVPWYAKINVFNSVLYFDWYFSAGAGPLRSRLDERKTTSQSPSYLKQDYTALYLGTGHLFHVGQRFLVRLDASGAYFNAPENGNSGDKAWFSNYLFGFGIALKL